MELTEQMRQVGVSTSEQLFRRCLQRNRLGRCTDEDTLLNKQRTATSMEKLNLPPETIYVAPTRDICQQTNRLKADALILSGEEKVHLWAQHTMTVRRARGEKKGQKSPRMRTFQKVLRI